MPVKIYIDKNKVEHRIEYAFHECLGILSNEILNDCNQYVKEDNGDLLMSSYIHSKLDEGKLIWQTPYARRQYWEIRTAYTDVNPNASWKWCEVAKRYRLKTWTRQAEKLMRGNL